MNYEDYMNKIKHISNILEKNKYPENVLNSKELNISEDFQYICLSSAVNNNLVNEIIARLAQNGNEKIIQDNLKSISLNMWKDLFNKNESIKQIFIQNHLQILENSSIITFREIENFMNDKEVCNAIYGSLDVIIRKMNTYDRASLISILKEKENGIENIKENLESFFKKGEFDITTTYSKILFELDTIPQITKLEILNAMCNNNLTEMLNRETAIDNETNKLLNWIYDAFEETKMTVEERANLKEKINEAILKNFDHILDKSNYNKNTIKILKQFDCTKEHFEKNKNEFIEKSNKSEYIIEENKNEFTEKQNNVECIEKKNNGVIVELNNSENKLDNKNSEEKIELNLEYEKKPEEKVELNLECDKKPEEKVELNSKHEKEPEERIGLSIEHERKPEEKLELNLKNENALQEKIKSNSEFEKIPQEKVELNSEYENTLKIKNELKSEYERKIQEKIESKPSYEIKVDTDSGINRIVEESIKQTDEIIKKVLQRNISIDENSEELCNQKFEIKKITNTESMSKEIKKPENISGVSNNLALVIKEENDDNEGIEKTHILKRIFKKITKLFKTKRNTERIGD